MLVCLLVKCSSYLLVSIIDLNDCTGTWCISLNDLGLFLLVVIYIDIDLKLYHQ